MTSPTKLAKRAPATVLKVTPAGQDHQVVSLKSQSKSYRKEPCPGCPWKTANAGDFPADAFKVSANTAYDMSTHVFSCHESGSRHPATCAGFLLRGADNNLSVRLSYINGKFQNDVTDGATNCSIPTVIWPKPTA
nr:DUF6283 family protein [Acidovorax sp. sic0104]